MPGLMPNVDAQQLQPTDPHHQCPPILIIKCCCYRFLGRDT